MARFKKTLPELADLTAPCVTGGPDRPQGGLDRGRRLGGNGGRDTACHLGELAGRHDLRDHAHHLGLAGRDPLVRAHQRHPHEIPEGHARGHQSGLEHRRHAVGHVGVEERRVLRGDDEVRLPEKVEGAASRHPVHGGDDRLPQSLAARPDVLAGVLVGVRVEVVLRLGGGHLAPVDPRAERSLTGPGQDDRTHGLIASQGLPHLSELVLHRLVEGVVHLRTIQRHHGDTVRLLVLQRVELHAVLRFHAVPGRQRSGPPAGRRALPVCRSRAS